MAVETPDDGEDVRPPWSRRLRERLGSRSSFWASARRANHGARATFDAAQSTRSRATQLLAGLGVVGIGASQLGPWGADTRGAAWDRATKILPLTYTSMAADSAATVPVVEPLSGLEPEGAIDLDTRRSWAATWTTPDPNGEPCLRQPGAVRLIVGFAEPVHVDRVSIAAGLPADAFDRAQQNRPRLVDIQLSDGTCEQLALDDDAGMQSVDIEGRDITTVTLSIVEVYPGESNSATGGLVAITEVVAKHR